MPYANINGIKIYYELKGNQKMTETVAFFNGLMQSAEHWAFQSTVFEKLGYKILLFDLRGQLMSDAPEEEYNLDGHIKDVKALLDELDLKKIHIIGTSYGGRVGMKFTFTYPDYVKSLSLIDTATMLDQLSRIKFKDWRSLIEKKDYEGYFWTMVSHVYGPEFIEINAGALKERLSILLKLPEKYFTGTARLLTSLIEYKNGELVDHIHKIKCPTLVVYGGVDELTVRSCSDIIAQKIPNSEYAIIPESGHVTIFEKPNTLNSVLLGFVKKYSEG